MLRNAPKIKQCSAGFLRACVCVRLLHAFRSFQLCVRDKTSNALHSPWPYSLRGFNTSSLKQEMIHVNFLNLIN